MTPRTTPFPHATIPFRRLHSSRLLHQRPSSASARQTHGRRAPLLSRRCLETTRLNMIRETWPQPRCGCHFASTFSQGSSFLATLGWRSQSLWDCSRPNAIRPHQVNSFVSLTASCKGASPFLLGCSKGCAFANQRSSFRGG